MRRIGMALGILLAYAGTAAGATAWVVDDDGVVDRRGMQIVEVAA